MKAPQMTAEQAKTFDRVSPKNAEILTQAADARGCTCVPYADWFTYNRWQAQSMQVQKGEKSIRIMTFIPYTKKENGQEVTKRRPKTACVFCRCQVKDKTAT